MDDAYPIDFNFYVKCARPLIYALARPRDRSVAAAWIKRLSKDETLSEEMKNDYIKFLMYFLEQKKLGGPFVKHPNSFDTLSDFPQNQNVFQTTKGVKKFQEQTEDSDLAVGLGVSSKAKPGDAERADSEETEGSDSEGSEQKTETDKKVAFKVPMGRKSKAKVPSSWGSDLLHSPYFGRKSFF